MHKKSHRTMKDLAATDGSSKAWNIGGSSGTTHHYVRRVMQIIIFLVGYAVLLMFLYSSSSPHGFPVISHYFIADSSKRFYVNKELGSKTLKEANREAIISKTPKEYEERPNIGSPRKMLYPQAKKTTPMDSDSLSGSNSGPMDEVFEKSSTQQGTKEPTTTFMDSNLNSKPMKDMFENSQIQQGTKESTSTSINSNSRPMDEMFENSQTQQAIKEPAITSLDSNSRPMDEMFENSQTQQATKELASTSMRELGSKTYKEANAEANKQVITPKPPKKRKKRNPRKALRRANKKNSKPESKLESVLRKASMGQQRTVILTSLNNAWAQPGSIFEVFLESFRVAGSQVEKLLNHLVVITWDQKSHNRCMSLHPHCYQIETNNVTGEAFFMDPNYLHMVWRKIEFLGIVLQLGYNFVFTDSDIMWLRNPFRYFYDEDADFHISCDSFNGNSSDMENLPNSGFSYVKSNERTIWFFNFWFSSREADLKTQDILNKIKLDPMVSEKKLKIRFLSTRYFGGFCEPSLDFKKVSTMHANCCLGLQNKVNDLRILLEDWRRYMALSEDEKNRSRPKWSVPQSCKPADPVPEVVGKKI